MLAQEALPVLALLLLVGSVLFLAVCAVATTSNAPPVTGGPGDLLEAAFLAGGPGRVADTVVCTMREDGRVAIDGADRLHVVRPVSHAPVEGELLALCGPEWSRPLGELRAALMRSASVQAVGDALAARGLLWRPEQRATWRIAGRVNVAAFFFAVLSFVAPLFLGGGGAPSGTQFALPPVAMLSLAAGRALAPSRSRLTRAGRRALRALRRQNPWAYGHGGTATGASLLAVGGLLALPDTELRTRLRDAARASGDASSGRSAEWGASFDTDSSGGASWCGSSGGGGGCGSSGCGGSGGCGGGGGGGGGCGGGGSSGG
ncbi:TIGR04222 domain-containing membrane protein [Streptomyces sp. NPDC054796]